MPLFYSTIGHENEVQDRDFHCDHAELSTMRDMIRGAAKTKGHLLSRAAILPDHIHLALGCNLGETPEVVALSYMNNLSFALGMKAVKATDKVSAPSPRS